MRAYLAQLAALSWKEALTEARSREGITSGVVFALLVLVTFNFALDLHLADAATLAPGVLWVAMTFAAVLSLGRAFSRERDRQTLDGLLLAPVDRSIIFFSKALATLGSLVIIELTAVPASIVLFGIGVRPAPLALALILGSTGLVGVGTLFAAIATNTRARDVLLPVLLLPVEVPVTLGAVKAIGSSLTSSGPQPADGANWLGLLAAFDALFLALSFLLFDTAIQAE